MKFTFTGKNIEFTESMKNITLKKIEGLCKYSRPLESSSVRVLARVYPNEKEKVEITIVPDAGKTVYRAEVTSDDYYEAVDRSVDILKGQIRKTKTILEEKRANRKEAVTLAKHASIIEDFKITENDEPEEEEE